MKNSALMFLRQVLNAGLQVFLLSYVLRQVSQDAYGLFLLAIGIEGVLTLSAEAINKGVVVQVAHSLEKKDQDNVNKVISSSVFFLAVPGVLAMILSIFAGKPLAAFVGASPQLQDTMGQIIFLTGIDVAILMPFAPFGGLIMAFQRYGVISFSDVLVRFIRVAMVVLFFTLFGPNVVFIMLSFLLSSVGQVIVLYVFARRLNPDLRVRLGHVHKPVLLGILGFGSFLVLGNLANLGATEASKWVVGKMLSLDYVTYMSVAVYASSMLLTAVLTMTTVLVPVASRYKAAENMDVISDMFVRSTRYASAISMMGTVVLLPMIGTLLSLWLKPEFRWIGPYAALVGICAGVCLPCSSVMQILNGMGDSKRPFWATMFRGVAMIVTTVVGIVVLKWEFMGVILGFCAGQILYWIILTVIGLRTIPVNRWHYFWSGYIQPILPAIPAYGAGLLWAYYDSRDNWTSLLISWGITLVAYVVFFLPFLTGQEKELVKKVWARVRGA